MARPTLPISSKNYSSWSLRGWLMAKLAGVEFDEVVVAPNDADARAEILLLSPSILVPCLTYNRIRVWDTLAIASFCTKSRQRRSCCLKTRHAAPIADRSAGKCIPASSRCARRCR